MKPQRSLKARALQFLAQREHSRLELRRKLMRHARAEDAAAKAAAADSDADGGPDRAIHAEDGADSETAALRVDALLDWLEAHKYLSQERFVESRVHARASRFGNLRIRSELQQHALTLSPEAAHALRDTELARARQVCARRFDAVTLTPADRARRARFLAGRGFSPDTIRRVLRGNPSADGPEGD